MQYAWDCLLLAKRTEKWCDKALLIIWLATILAYNNLFSMAIPASIKILHDVRWFWAFLEENGDTNEAVIENLGQADEAEAHTKSQ